LVVGSSQHVTEASSLGGGVLHGEFVQSIRAAISAQVRPTKARVLIVSWRFVVRALGCFFFFFFSFFFFLFFFFFFWSFFLFCLGFFFFLFFFFLQLEPGPGSFFRRDKRTFLSEEDPPTETTGSFSTLHSTLMAIWRSPSFRPINVIADTLLPPSKAAALASCTPPYGTCPTRRTSLMELEGSRWRSDFGGSTTPMEGR